MSGERNIEAGMLELATHIAAANGPLRDTLTDLALEIRKRDATRDAEVKRLTAELRRYQS